MEKTQANRKEISKKGFVGLTFLVIGMGLAGILLFSSMFISNNMQVWADNTFLIAFWSISLILVGVGIGLAISRIWRIKDYE